MSGFPTAYAQEVIDYITGRAVATTAAGTTYLAACTADPGVGATLATLNEDTTAGYARQPITWSAPAIPADPADGTAPIATNAANITFGPYTAAMANSITNIALVTAASGTTGKVKWVWDVAEFRAAVGDSLFLPAGSVKYGAQG